MKVGIIGCGQLAQMLAHAAHRLGVDTCFAAEPGESTNCVAGLGEITQITAGMSGASLYDAMGHPDVITVEREQVDMPLLHDVAEHCPVHPDPALVASTGNRLLERGLLVRLGLPVAPYTRVRFFDDIVEALPGFDYPVFIKSAEQGYDGKNQWRLDGADGLPALSQAFVEQPCVMEAGIDFKAEVSMVGARGIDGEMRFFPLTENHHHDGILIASFSPARDGLGEWEETARQYLAKILEANRYVGVMAAEMFVTQKGLVINELAPRVHNSGHWTMNGCRTSQFEQHIRAITGQSLAPVRASGATAMVNILGNETPIENFSHPAATLHSYGKSPRPGRKLAHINFTHPDRYHVWDAAEALVSQLYPEALVRSTAHAANG